MGEMCRWARTLILTVSVEPDDPSVVGRTGAYRSLEGLGRFHELCRRHGVRPTYLLTYSAACEARCADAARAWGVETEFGAHLHPEEVPPIADGERGNHTLRPGDVAPERLRAKLVNLLDRVAEATGRRPTSFRSGFFGLTPALAAALGELGVEADSSLGPLEKVGQTYPYIGVPFAPYVFDPARCGALIEVPLTSVFRRPFPRALYGAYVRLPGRVRGALRACGLAEIVRFRPAAASERDLLAVCERTARLGIPAVMTVHSNELWPGTSAAVGSQAASDAYYARLERVLVHARERGWASLTLTEAARRARETAA
ncbi:MAG TPA: hypothetical protein PLE19_01665 [Planctomycetota bacterium]|nr:hypothetical protein [Planctomycetota bacterium]HRR78871.1 hypothetical protein [Planctomycetota bacterium]HRT94992.1 hypothetical protein [Planctomycetota bacterium]